MNKIVTTSLVFLILLCMNLAFSQENPLKEMIETVAVSDAKTTEVFVLDPGIVDMLTTMSEYLASKPIVQFEVIDTIDHIHEDGLRVQLTHKREGLLQRPDKYRSIVNGDRIERHSVFVDGHLKVYRPDENIYLEKKDLPSSLEETLDLLAKQVGLSLPLADFLRAKAVDQELLDQILYAEFIGESTIEPAGCDHLSFEHVKVDWQIWIQNTGEPLPRKMVITYKDIPGSPQYTAHFKSWNFPKSVPENAFKLEIPETAEHIQMISQMAQDKKEEAK